MCFCWTCRQKRLLHLHIQYIFIFNIYVLTVNTVQTDIDPWEPGEADCPSETSRTGLTCEGCGKTFQNPILATVLTGGHKKKYYACPRCMTQVQDVKPSEKREGKHQASTMEQSTLTTGTESTGSCGHFFGYLKKRDRQTAIPEECLTCAEMVECLFHDAKT